MTKLWLTGVVAVGMVGCASHATLGYGDEDAGPSNGSGGATLGSGGTSGAPDGNTGNVPAWAEGLGGTYSNDPMQPPPVDPSVLVAGTVPPGCEGRQEPFNPTITYRGYIQGFQSNGWWPSETVILKFTELSTSAVTGRVLNEETAAGNYGAPTLDPVATDPIAGDEGFQYTMSKGSFDGQRLQLTANLKESMCAWCGQQTPIAWDEGRYGCMPNAEGRFSANGCAIRPSRTSDWQHWDCTAMAACQLVGLCSCAAGGCTANVEQLTFDLVVAGDQMTGPAGTLGNVILTRDDS